MAQDPKLAVKAAKPAAKKPTEEEVMDKLAKRTNSKKRRLAFAEKQAIAKKKSAAPKQPGK